MSVPSTFSSTGDYLEAALQFLKQYKWLYNSKNTDILTKRVLSNFSDEWVAYFNTLSIDGLHELVNGIIKDCAPSNLKIFVDEMNNLKPQALSTPIRDTVINCQYGISDKKMHEIALLAPVINEICQETECDLIVDIGSGLGYLPHLLHEQYGSLVLGLETSEKFVKLAQQNQEKKHPHFKNSVIFCKMFIDKHSDNEIEKIIEEKFGIGKHICITGLHACADLSVEVLELFTKIKNAKALVIMPCCYHRINVEKADAERTYFKNFPASDIMMHLFERYDARTFIGQPFLRLACQQTFQSFNNMSKEEHTNHSLQCMYRAILQLAAERGGWLRVFISTHSPAHITFPRIPVHGETRVTSTAASALGLVLSELP